MSRIDKDVSIQDGNNLKCVICDNFVKWKSNPLCVKCSPFLYEKRKFPHQKLRNTKEWQKQREERFIEVGYKCEWCGAGREKGIVLLPHHEKHAMDSNAYGLVWDNVVKKAIKKFLEKDEGCENYCKSFLNFHIRKSVKQSINFYYKKAQREKKEKSIKCCPKCNRSSIRARKIITPIYKCSCGHEFNRPKTRGSLYIIENITSLKNFLKTGKDKGKCNSIRYATFQAHLKFSRKIFPLLYDRFKLLYNKEVQKIITKYGSMEGTVILCRKCNWHAERGEVMCKCKEGYYSSRYTMCFSCYKKTMICKVCGKNYYKNYSEKRKSIWYYSKNYEKSICTDCHQKAYEIEQKRKWFYQCKFFNEEEKYSGESCKLIEGMCIYYHDRALANELYEKDLFCEQKKEVILTHEWRV